MNQRGENLFYKTIYVLVRSFSGLRQRPWMHVMSVLTLGAAFLSFGATLTAAFNLERLIGTWVGSGEVTVYMKPDTSAPEQQKLKTAVETLEGVHKATILTSEQARERFAQTLGTYEETGATLPQAAFPPSLEIQLDADLTRDDSRRKTLAHRIAKVPTVDDVEIYDDWFGKLAALSTMGKTAAWGLGLLAAVVAILVVAATIRAGVDSRRQEIAVMRYVGATERYVRLPFLIEGAAESTTAMLLAIVALDQLMNHVDTIASGVMPIIGGGALVRLDAPVVLTMIGAGLVAGLIGARISLGRLEER